MTMMKAFSLAVAMLCMATVQAAEYNQIELKTSSIKFISKQMGVPVEGQFGRFAAQFSFNPDKPQAARAAIDIDMASIDAGSPEANEEVVGKNWFAVKQFPSGRFVASTITPLGANRYQVTGKLTLRNITRDVTAPFTFNNGVFEGRYILKRLDYGIGQGVWADVGTVSDEVEIRFRFTAQVAAPLKK